MLPRLLARNSATLPSLLPDPNPIVHRWVTVKVAGTVDVFLARMDWAEGYLGCSNTHTEGGDQDRLMSLYLLLE